MVDPREYRLGGPEVGRQDDRVADPLLGPQIGGDVGPAEPVDGLLRIPDQEQAPWRYRHVGPVGRAAGPAGGDADGQLDLDRVGVLELIQQQPPVLLVQGDSSRTISLVVADGYHRICAICYFDEDAPIVCRLVAQ